MSKRLPVVQRKSGIVSEVPHQRFFGGIGGRKLWKEGQPGAYLQVSVQYCTEESGTTDLHIDKLQELINT